jgi:hypothetical protein
LALSTTALFAQQVETQVLFARQLCDLQDTRINESSGLAASSRYAQSNLLWTHNDSGGEPKIYAIKPQGQTVAEVLLRGATNIDWEDIGISGGWIYVADTGDNLHKRANVTIYRLREPELDPKKIGQMLETDCETMTLQYPDGAHDCETLLPLKNGELLLVSKNGGASQIYKTPEPFQNITTQTLAKIGEYSFTGATARSMLTSGGSVSPDEKHLVIRTYTHAYEWTIPAKIDGHTFWKSAPRIFELPPCRQGESICYSADGTKYFATSEGVPTPLFMIESEEE